MIQDKLVIHANGTDPYKNLALEQALMSLAHTAVLYLWQNVHTIVIGRNQDAFAECRVEEFLASGGKIARRCTGGGAVYHDTGNLNYTLILPKEDFDIPGQMDMVCRALAFAGIPGVEWNGRNDLVVNGQKCSGNAFQMTKTAGCHHGTILISADFEALGRYLTPEKSKLMKHGIQSVSSRVVNLNTIVPGLTAEAVCSALIMAFQSKYGEARRLTVEELGREYPSTRESSEKDALFLGSTEWLYPERGDVPVVREACFSWGSFRSCMEMHNGKIARAVFFTDALDAEFFPKVAELLTGHDPKDAETLLNAAFPDASPARRKMIEDISGCIGK